MRGMAVAIIVLSREKHNTDRHSAICSQGLARTFSRRGVRRHYRDDSKSRSMWIFDTAILAFILLSKGSSRNGSAEASAAVAWLMRCEGSSDNFSPKSCIFSPMVAEASVVFILISWKIGIGDGEMRELTEADW